MVGVIGLVVLNIGFMFAGTSPLVTMSDLVGILVVSGDVICMGICAIPLVLGGTHIAQI